MKKVATFIVLGLLLCSAGAYAQDNLSLWTKYRGGTITMIPWYVFDNGKVFVDARYNFDALKTGAVLVGKSFGDSSLMFSPAVGGMVGNYRAVSPELNVSGTLGKINFFTLNQYSFGLGSSPDFAYHWLDLLYPLGNGGKVFVGLNEQVYWEPHTSAQIDLGPVVKVVIGKHCFVKVWYAFANEGANKIFLGIGVFR